MVNAAILILAAAAFHAAGKTDVEDLSQAHGLIAPLIGSTLAPTLFARALLCCSLNSTITATMAGQVVMEGVLDIRLKPWLRRLIPRMIAIVPAAGVVVWHGSEGAAKLLVLTQVVLGLQLPFAVIPLVLLTASRRKIGALATPRPITAIAVAIAAALVMLNLKVVVDIIAG